MYLAYKQSAWGEWPQPPLWGTCLPPVPIHATYQAGAQPILDLRPLELTVPYQWSLDTAFAPWLEVHAELNEVARAAMDTLDFRFNSVPTTAQYKIYCDGSFTPPVHATTKREAADQKAGWAFVVTAQSSPTAADEVIVGIAAGPLLPQQIAQQGLTKQSAETAEAYALHQAVKWALAQTEGSWYPVTIYYDCAGAGDPAAGRATPSADTKTIARATRALVHYAESHGIHIEFEHVHSHQGHALNELADNMAKAGASFSHCSGLPYQLDQAWYQEDNATADWAWLTNLSPFTKTQYDLPQLQAM